MSFKITKSKNAIIAVILYALFGLFDLIVGINEIVFISDSALVLALRLLLCFALCVSILFENKIAVVYLSAFQILLSIICIIFIDNHDYTFPFTVYCDILIYWTLINTMAVAYCKDKKIKYMWVGPALMAVIFLPVFLATKPFEYAESFEIIIYLCDSLLKIVALFFMGKWVKSTVTFSENDSDNMAEMNGMKNMKDRLLASIKPGKELRHLRNQDSSEDK